MTRTTALLAFIVVFLTGCRHDLSDVPACVHDRSKCDTGIDEDSSLSDSGAELGDTAVEDSGSGPDALEAATDSSSPDVTEDVLNESGADGGDASSDSGPDACASLTCTSPPAVTCASGSTRRTFASTGTCIGGTCSYAPIDIACPTGEVCSGGTCSPPSCAGGLSCGSASCCDSKAIPGGTFLMGRATTGPEASACSTWAAVPNPTCEDRELPEHSATVSSFRLDTFEVTVGRFRKFVEAYPSSKPSVGAGAHPLIAGSGWQAAWDASMPATKLVVRSNLDGWPRPQRESADHLHQLVHRLLLLCMGRCQTSDGSRVGVRGSRRQRQSRVAMG